MKPELSSSLLVQFDRANSGHADLSEVASDVCLYFVRVALGKVCILPRKRDDRFQVVEHTNSVALKALAGLMAFTLWLPITFIGIILHYTSQSHEGAYRSAQKCLEQYGKRPLLHTTPSSNPASMPPAIAQSSKLAVSSQRTSATAAAPIQSSAETKLAREQLEKCLKAYAGHIDQKKQLEEMSKLFSISSIPVLESFMEDLNAHPEKYSAEVQEVLLEAALAKAAGVSNSETTRGGKLEDLILRRYIKMNNEEHARYLPLLEKFKLSTLKHDTFRRFQITADNSRAIGDLVMKKIKPKAQDLWSTWRNLWIAYKCDVDEEFERKRAPVLASGHQKGHSFSKEADKALDEIDQEWNAKLKLMLQDALNIIGDDPYQLAKLFEATTVEGMYMYDTYCKLLMQLMTNRQLAKLTQGLQLVIAEKGTDYRGNVSFLGLSRAILEALPDGTIRDKIERACIVPVTLGKHPLTWITNVSKYGEHCAILEYCLLHEVQRVLTNAESQDGTQQVQAIAKALNIWSAHRPMRNFLPSLTRALAELSVSELHDHYALICDGYALSYKEYKRFLRPEVVQKSVLSFFRKLSSKYSKTLENQQACNPSTKLQNKFQHLQEMQTHLSKQWSECSKKISGADHLHFEPTNIMREMLKLPMSAQKLQAVFSRFIQYVLGCGLSSCRHGWAGKKVFRCFEIVIPRICTEAALDAAIRAILASGSASGALQKLLLNRSKMDMSPEERLGLTLSPEQVAARFQAIAKQG